MAEEKKDSGGLLLLLGAGAAAVGTYLLFRSPAKAAGSHKKPGDSLLGNVTFHHFGEAEDIWIGLALQRQPAAPLTDFTHIISSVTRDGLLTKYPKPGQAPLKVSLKVPQLSAGKYTVFAFIQYKGGPLNTDGSGYRATRTYAGQLVID